MDTSLTSTPEPQGALAQAQSAYEKAQNELLAKIASRESKTDIPWFAIAGALLKPTRTGAFGESLGNAGDVMGQWQENQKKEELTNAQMRAQITKSILDSAYDRSASQQLAQLNGQAPTLASVMPNMAPPVNPTAPAEATTAPVASPTAVQGTPLAPAEAPSKLELLQKSYPSIALSPKFGPIAKSMIDFETENRKAGTELRKADIDAIKGLENVANLNSPFAQALIHSLSPAGQKMFAELQAQKSTVQAPTAPVANPTVAPASAPLPSGPLPASIASSLGITPKDVAPAPSALSGQRPDLTPTVSPPAVGNTGLSPKGEGEVAAEIAKQQAIIEMQLQKSRQETREEPTKEKIKSISVWDKGATTGEKQLLEELYGYTKQPKLWGPLQQTGALGALLTAAQQGFQIPKIGNIGLPVEDATRKFHLTKNEQTDYTRIQQILGELFFERAKNYKSVLGPSISNADVTLEKQPIATSSDSAQATAYWIKHNLVINHQKELLNNALNAWYDKHGNKEPANNFFNSPEYNKVFEETNSMWKDLIANHRPNLGAKQ